RFLQIVQKAVPINCLLEITATKKLIKNSIRDLGFLASGHGIAPLFPLCPNHTRKSGQSRHKRQKLEPHREFLEACHAEKPDVTLQALCDRLLAERGVKADTSLMSRFLRRLGLTPKKRRSLRANRTARM